MIGTRKSRIEKRLEECRSKLLRLAWSWTRNPDLAEELVQDCLLKALDNLDQLRDDNRLEVWVARILSNSYRDSLRRFNPETADEDPELLADAGKTPEQQAQLMQAREILEESLGQLKSETRQVITLVDIAGFSYAECAEILDVPAGTVMSRLSRGRDQLLKLIDGNHNDEGNVVSLRRKS